MTLEARKRKSSGSDGGPPKITCPTCGQQFLLKSLLKIEDKPHCPFCLAEIKKQEKESSVTFDETVEMVELTTERARINRLSRKRFSKTAPLADNYEIAQAKVEVAGKGNPLFKMFGSLTAWSGKEFSIAELEDLAIEKELSMESILRAYEWAVKKATEKPAEPEWFANKIS